MQKNKRQNAPPCKFGQHAPISGAPAQQMPKKFDNCAKHGGKVRTKTVPGGYLHICKSRAGKWSAGHVHHKR